LSLKPLIVSYLILSLYQNFRKRSNIPLLIQNGLDYTYTHRSFQEYFTAYCIVNNSNINHRIVEKVFKRFRTDNVMNMAYSINRSVVEDKWILPKIDEILNSVNNDISENSKLENMCLFFDDVSTFIENNRDVISFTSGFNQYFTQLLIDRYNLGGIYQDVRATNPIETDEYSEIEFIELVLRNELSTNLSNLNEYEKGLFYKLDSYKLAEYSIQMLNIAKDKIIKSRKNIIGDIENLIFDS
ncbi:hypothetical protein ACEYX7_10580, partial [Acinetobacter sp. c1-l78]